MNCTTSSSLTLDISSLHPQAIRASGYKDSVKIFFNYFVVQKNWLDMVSNIYPFGTQECCGCNDMFLDTTLHYFL